MAKGTLAEKPLPKNKLKFVAEYVQDGNGTRAVKKAFGTKKYMVAANKASRLLNNAKIKDAIAEALPDDLLAKVHVEGLHATLPLVIKGQIKDYDDYRVRHSYLDTAYKIRKKYADAPSTTNVFVADAKILVLAKEYEDKLNATLDGKQS